MKGFWIHRFCRIVRLSAPSCKTIKNRRVVGLQSYLKKSQIAGRFSRESSYSDPGIQQGLVTKIQKNFNHQFFLSIRMNRNGLHQLWTSPPPQARTLESNFSAL
jgi:hypothetical protein